MKKILIISLFFLLNMHSAHAILNIEITKGAEGAAPIAIIPFQRTGLTVSAPTDVSSIIA